MKRRCTWYIALGWLALTLAGCAPVPPSMADRGYPPDFSMVFTVEHEDAASADDPLHESAQHVVLPDRTFRAALGRGAGHDYHPQITARLSPEQMVELYRMTEAAGLLEPSRDEVDPEAEPLRYQLAITAHGYRRNYVTTPEQRPAATLLLRHLVELREGR